MLSPGCFPCFETNHWPFELPSLKSQGCLSEGMYGFHSVMKYVPGEAYLPLCFAGCVYLVYSKLAEVDISWANVVSVTVWWRLNCACEPSYTCLSGCTGYSCLISPWPFTCPKQYVYKWVCNGNSSEHLNILSQSMLSLDNLSTFSKSLILMIKPTVSKFS